MNLSKVSKKTPHADSRMTLKAMHDMKLEEFRQEKEDLPRRMNELKEKIRYYKILKSEDPRNFSKDEIGDMRSDDMKKKIEELHNLHDEITKEQENIYRIKNNMNESEYLMGASKYFEMYYEECQKEKGHQVEQKEEEQSEEVSEDDEGNIDMYLNKKNVSKKGKIYNDYVANCFGVGKFKSAQYWENKNLLCKDCKVNRIIIHQEAMATCPQCGVQVPFQDQKAHVQYSEEVEILSPFAYKRINKFGLIRAAKCTSQGELQKYNIMEKILLIYFCTNKSTTPLDELCSFVNLFVLHLLKSC